MAEQLRALISVSDKTGVAEFARELVSLGFQVISTGGTKRAIEGAGVDVTSVSEITDFPEILDGRVKTLHPAVHAGLLATGDEDHQQQLEELGLAPIQLVCVNLYPFGETIRKPGSTFDDAVENIDIGGPTMVRAAAKNHGQVAVVVDPSDYAKVTAELGEKGEVSLKTRRELAAKAFRHTAAYDALIAGYMTEQTEADEWPETLTVTFDRSETLRYGENPHQKAAFYRHPLPAPGWLTSAEQIHGKALSYNNINDANAALEILREFDEPAAIAVKHTNPCGVGLGDGPAQAFERARKGDPISIFGGIIAFNREVDVATAQQLNELFLEIVLAPSFDDEALEVLRKKKNRRLLVLNDAFDEGVPQAPTNKMISVQGGLLVQSADLGSLENAEWEVVTEREPTAEEIEALKFNWRVCKHVKSNAIVVGGAKMTYGIGAGQMNRVGAAKIAIAEAGDDVVGAVMASDAFFPMRDTVDVASDAGIAAIIQPGGSIRDEESIEAANEAGIAMVMTGMRHFKH